MSDPSTTYDHLVLAVEKYKSGVYQEAIDAFRKSIVFVDNCSYEQVASVYSSLACAYKGLGDLGASIRAWEISLSYRKPISPLDPFLGNGCIYEKVDREQLELLKSTCNSFECDFIPSFRESNYHCIEPWENLMYLHIPKCGGSSFEIPLHMIKRYLVDAHRKHPNLIGTYRYLNAGMQLTKKEEVTALMNLTSLGSSKELKSTFLVTHTSAWSDLYQHICKMLNAHPKIIATIREPRQRLLSHIKSYSDRTCISLEDLLRQFEDKNCRFNNFMHKHIFDYGLKGSESCSQHEYDMDKSNLIDNIEFIDISDASTISKVKSAFLSASLMPNIVQYSRLNDSKQRKSGKLSKQNIEYAFKQCLDRGFLVKDESIDYDMLKKRTRSRLIFPSVCNAPISQIHPLTFVVSRNPLGYMIPTKQFLKDPLQILIKLNSQFKTV